MNKKTLNIITWILQGIISVFFLMSGGMKLATPYAEFVETMPYAEDFSANTIMLIGILEILGVIGMSLPLIINKLKFFSPLSAIGLTGTMIGAILVHIGRSEAFAMQSIFLLMLLFIAYVRYKGLNQAK